jgi:hypothetical protein
MEVPTDFEEKIGNRVIHLVEEDNDNNNRNRP